MGPQKPQSHLDWSVEERRMGFRLQTKMFDGRANITEKCSIDNICRACQQSPSTGLKGLKEIQEHQEVCPKYCELCLWQGLGPLTTQYGVKYLLKLKANGLKSSVVAQRSCTLYSIILSQSRMLREQVICDGHPVLSLLCTLI